MTDTQDKKTADLNVEKEQPPVTYQSENGQQISPDEPKETVTAPGPDQEHNKDQREGIDDHTLIVSPRENVQTDRNVRFNGSARGSNGEIIVGKRGSNGEVISPGESIVAILNDVEFDESSHTPAFTSAADGQTSRRSQRSQRRSRDIDIKERWDEAKLPSILSKEAPKRKRHVKKRISNSPPRYYYEHRRIFHNKARLTKVFTKPPKYAMLKSEANYIRMCKIVVTLGTILLRDILRMYMDRIYPPKTLQQFLQNYKRRLVSFSSTDKLLSSRWKVLFPDGNQSVNLQQLDIALIFWFLRHICHFKKQNDLVWKWKPAHSDLSIVADVCRIRDLRNGLLNATEHALYDEEYERKIEDFKKIMGRCSGERNAAEMFEMVTEMKIAAVKLPERDQYLDILGKWAEETKDRNIEKIAPCKQDWETVKECKEVTRRFLRRFGRAAVFVKTKIYQHAKEKLMQNGFVIIKGNTGEGKTTAALALMASMHEEDENLVMSSAEHWKYINKHSVGAILIDDFMGSMHFDEKQLTDWEIYFDEMYRGCGGRQGRQDTSRQCDACASKKERAFAKVIITVRKHVFDQCWARLSEHKLFAKENVVEWSSKDLQFVEKRTMLSRHILADHKIKSEMDKSAKLPISKLGFPQSCAVFVSQEAFLDLGSQFFERPIEILQHSLDDLFHKDMYGYLALVLMMFQPGAVLFLKKLQEYTDDTFKKHVLDLAGVCEVPVSEHLPAFCLMALNKSLKPYVYYYEDLACFAFVHESVMEIMMATFVERHPQHVLETCALQFIMDYVTTDVKVEVPRDQLFVMRMKKQNFWLLAQLFDHYMSYGYVVKVAQHRALREPMFMQYFFNHIKKKDLRDEFILRVDNSVKDIDEDRHVGFLYGAVDQDKPNVELAIAILRLGVHVKKSFNPEWCLSELRSSLCVAVKRGNFALYSALVATKIDIPDKLITHKEYLTSIDIVADVLRKRPWSKEQKDIALVRASRLATHEGAEIVSLLLQHDASVSSIRCETTALCEAVKAGNEKTVSLLLSSGASVYDRDLNDQSPLHHACDWNRLETAKLLLQKGADVNTKDTSGLSPFLVAAGWGRDEILQMLLAKRVDPLAVDEQDNTFLHICAANGQTAAMRAVIYMFPDDILPILIARNKYGWTPLDFAMKCGHLGVAKLLVRAILQIDTQKPGHKTFVHTRFNVVKLEDIDKNERCLHRFIDLDSERACFQIPRGKWFIESGNKEEYEKVTSFVSRYEDRLKLRYAKS